MLLSAKRALKPALAAVTAWRSRRSGLCALLAGGV